MCPVGRFNVAYHLAQDDVQVNHLRDPKIVVVRIKVSKTDPFQKKVSVFLGRTSQNLFTVAVNFSQLHGAT